MLTFGLLTTAAVHGTPIQSRSQSAILNVTPKLQKASSIKHVIFYTKVQAKVVKQLSPKKLFSDNFALDTELLVSANFCRQNLCSIIALIFTVRYGDSQTTWWLTEWFVKESSNKSHTALCIIVSFHSFQNTTLPKLTLFNKE